MKKILTFLLIPFLFFTIEASNLFLLNSNKEVINENDRIINLSLGSYSTGMTVDNDNDNYADTLYMWGSNSSGQIGNGNSGSNVLVPTIITPSVQSDWGGNIIDLSLDGKHTGVTVDTDDDGYADTLYMWGSNNRGQIGNGEYDSNVLVPIIITPSGQSDWGGNIIDLSLGGEHTGVTVDTDDDGYADTLYMWGRGNYGEIGDGGQTSRILNPKIITPSGQSDWGGNIIDLSLGGEHTGVTVDSNDDGYADTLYMWGNDSYGQIGDGNNSNTLTPTIITPSGQSDWGGNIIDLSLLGANTGLTIDTNDDGYADVLYLWGNNDYGQIGDGTYDLTRFPKKITPNNQSDWGGNIIDLSLNTGVTVDSNDDGYADTLYIWGNNSAGQVGDGSHNSTILTPTIITPEDQNGWGGNIIDLSLGSNHTGITIDINNDGYADTLYMWGSNEYGQIGDGTYENKYYPELITSIYSFFIKNINFYYQSNNNIEFNLQIDDYQNIINDAPEVILIDDEDNNYTTTFIASESDIESDQYYYQINDILYGESYQFNQISINDNIFKLNQERIQTDYLISDYNFVSSTEETETIILNLDQNSDDFNILNYSENERKVEVNYTDIDKNVSNSQQFVLNQTNEVTLTNLNAETNYRIDSINYFYEDNNYKYTIEQETKIFRTDAAIPLIDADSISLIGNSVTTNSFQYTIEIDNLKPNSSKDNFTQYDINNGIWLIDDSGNTYNSSFIDERLISNGEINGTQNYQLTFLQEDLLSGQTYNFIGIGFNDPNGANPDTINFSSPFEVTTIIINKKFVDNSFDINPESITTNSFEYTILIDNLILIDDIETEPTFSNFNLNENLYLKDQNDNVFPSSYVSNSAINKGAGEEEGTVKYQFTFKVNNLNENTTYNFTNLSFTEDFNDSIDISAKGTVTTANNVSEKIIIWIIIIILIIFILLILILILVDLKMKKRTKEISDKLNNYDEL